MISKRKFISVIFGAVLATVLTFGAFAIPAAAASVSGNSISGNSVSGNSASSSAGGTATSASSSYTAPTPEEIYYKTLSVAFPAGHTYYSTGSGDSAFAEFGKNGSTVSLWKSGKRIASMQLIDSTGANVAMKLIGIKKIDGINYFNVMAWSKNGGLKLVSSADYTAVLQKLNLGGVVISGKVLPVVTQN